MKSARVVPILVWLHSCSLLAPCYAQYYDSTRTPASFHTYMGLGGRSNRNQTSGLAAISRPSPSSQYRNAPRQYSTKYSTSALRELQFDAESANNWLNTVKGQSPSVAAASYGSYTSTPTGGLLPKVGRKDLLRVFLQGGSLFDGGGESDTARAGSGHATGTAYSNYQTAENMAARARNAAERARYGNDKGSKQNAANESNYDANDAEGAADRAYSAAASGDSEARGYANSARQAANRAREDANRARYNADTSS